MYGNKISVKNYGRPQGKLSSISFHEQFQYILFSFYTK